MRENPIGVNLSPMDFIAALEWGQMIRLAEEQALSEPARRTLQSWVHPSSWTQDIASARILQQETWEAQALLNRDGLWGILRGLGSTERAIDILRKKGTLDVPLLALIRSWADAVDFWFGVPHEELRGELFRKSISSLRDVSGVLRILQKILTPEGQLSENASPVLASLYQSLRNTQQEISIRLDSTLKRLDAEGVLQESYSDVRDGRYVIPVKISHQSQVDGILHETSVSRQTVFIEPKEITLLNNKLRRTQGELEIETQRILRECSELLRPYADDLEWGAQVLAHWDCAQARARMGQRYEGKSIQVTEQRTFRIKSTAHPLLWLSLKPEQIIRNDLFFGDPEMTLLLTGPNTGGKTVFLKTLGLAAICARTGIPFPSGEAPTVPFFDRLFVDIGDPQSLEQHLSSFSGHIKKLKDVLENHTSRSLILLDEMNSATDPEEGAALGRAFLETLMKSGALIVATTHDPQLKALVATDKRIASASMAFDEASRMPSYHLVFGLPGRSRALETAERLGLSTEVLTLARSYLSSDHQRLESLLSNWEKQLQEAAQAKKEAARMREEAEQLRNQWMEKVQTSVGDALDRTRQRLKRILEQAQDEVRAKVRQLEETRSRKDLQSIRGTLGDLAQSLNAQLEKAVREEAPELATHLLPELQATPLKPQETSSLRIGDWVRVPRWKNTGQIIDLLDAGKIKVSAGAMQMVLSPGEYESTSPPKKTKKTSGLAALELSRPATPPSQLDIRGKRLDEAMSEVENYLDQAYRSGGLQQVTIVHGLGTGALREGTRQILAKLPYIKHFQDGGPGQGGSGATWVEFEL